MTNRPRKAGSNVIIVIENVSEIAFREGNATRQILSDGLTVCWFDGCVWCDLSPYGSEPDTVEDFRRSDFYVVGKTFSWQVEQYSEVQKPGVSSGFRLN